MLQSKMDGGTGGGVASFPFMGVSQLETSPRTVGQSIDKSESRKLPCMQIEASWSRSPR